MKSMRKQKKKRHGFTLIDLLVVIAIIAILAAMLLPALKSARRRSLASNCTANLKQLGASMDLYTGANRDHYPFYCYDDEGNHKAGKNI